MLAEWGQRRFEGRDRKGDMSPKTEEFKDEIMDMGFNRDSGFPARRSAAIQEIREVGLREGGWTVYGAWEAIEMMHAQFGDLHAPEDILQELMEARVRFLQTLDEPKMATRLNTHDISAFRDLFPEDHARMFPNWG
ncbi:MAG TPA: hypothetical protein VL988_06380 [Solirubrobacteraceae bacterium]|nr:hypothetical protein [Solirubrobacteraceae bacterium]